MNSLLLLIVGVGILVVHSDAHVTTQRPRTVTPTAVASWTTSTRKATTAEVKPENKVLRYDVQQTETGSKFVYELEDGQFREEEVMVLNKGAENQEIVVIGSYSFWGTDKDLYITHYKADRDGYSAHTQRGRNNEVMQEMKETSVWSKQLKTVLETDELL